MKKETIESSEISVVIQGPIFSDHKTNVDYTKRACQSVRHNLPGAEIIISTWEGENTAGLDYDILVKNIDPGNFSLILPQKMNDNSDVFLMNINRQIVSTIGGIKKANKKYICKMRSDSILSGNNFLREYCKYSAPINRPYNQAIKHRVVTLTSVNPKRYFPFALYICDWFFFGEKADVECIWDIPLVEASDLYGKTRDGLYFMDNNFGNEQYIWIRFLRKFMDFKIINGCTLNNELLRVSEESYANCCIFLTASKAQIESLKVKKTGYGATPCLSNAGTYTSNEWKRLYNKYGNGHLFFLPNPFEQIMYLIIGMFRSFKKTKLSFVYNKITNVYHKFIR